MAFFIPIVLALAAVQGVSEQPVNLTCGGGGTANKLAVATADSSGGFTGTVGITRSTVPLTAVRPSRAGDGKDSRTRSIFARLVAMTNPTAANNAASIHGGSDGWFKLKDVKVDARSIHASAAVNFMNNPKVYIDRVTGTISISGKAGDYSGQCEAVRADTPAKF